MLFALSFAAVAGAQDDDLDALLAGLGEDDPFAEAPAAVDVAETAPDEVDPFADLFDGAEAIPEETETVVEEVAEVAEPAVAAAGDAAEAAVEEAAGAAEAFDEDAFADFFDEAPVAEAAAEPAPANDDLTDAFPADEFDQAMAAIPEAVENVEAAAAEIPADDDFDAFFDDFAGEVPAEPATEAAEAVEEAAVAPEAAAEPAAAEFVETVEVAEFPEEPAPAEADGEVFADDFFVEVPAAEPEPEPAAEPEAEIVAEQAAVEQLAAEVETARPAEDEVATQAEGEAAAAELAERVRPVEPAVKPAAEKKGKKDKFSSEARRPLTPKTSVPAWDEPVTMDGSEPAPAAAAPAAKPASRGAWDEPVLW